VYQKYNVLSNRQLPIGPAVPTRRGNVISGALQPLASGTPQDRKRVSEQFTVADSRQKYPASGKTSQKATFWIAHLGNPDTPLDQLHPGLTMTHPLDILHL
jgi:hypothetical protein